MNKLKTNRGVYKRFKKTKNGNYKHKQSHLRHILTKKNSKRKRQLRHLKIVDKSNEKAIKKALLD